MLFYMTMTTNLKILKPTSFNKKYTEKGECLFAACNSGEQNFFIDAIESWLTEKKKFSFDEKPLKGNNWTQIIWKSAESRNIIILFIIIKRAEIHF